MSSIPWTSSSRRVLIKVILALSYENCNRVCELIASFLVYHRYIFNDFTEKGSLQLKGTVTCKIKTVKIRKSHPFAGNPVFKQFIMTSL